MRPGARPRLRAAAPRRPPGRRTRAASLPPSRQRRATRPPPPRSVVGPQLPGRTSRTPRYPRPCGGRGPWRLVDRHGPRPTQHRIPPPLLCRAGREDTIRSLGAACGPSAPGLGAERVGVLLASIPGQLEPAMRARWVSTAARRGHKPPAPWRAGGGAAASVQVIRTATSRQLRHHLVSPRGSQLANSSKRLGIAQGCADRAHYPNAELTPSTLCVRSRPCRCVFAPRRGSARKHTAQ